MTSRVSSKNKEKKAKRKKVFKKRDQKRYKEKQKTAPTVNKVTSRPEVPTGRSIS